MRDINVHLENKKASRVFFVYIFIMYAVVYMTKSCFSGALTAIKEAGTFEVSQITFIAGSFYLVYAPLQILGGFFADKYSPEKLITIGLLGGALSNTVIFFNQNYYVMLFSWIFNAIIQFALWPSVFKIISSQLVRSDRKNMIFLISIGTSGGLILTYIVSACLSNVHWKYNFAVSAVSLVICAIIMKIFCIKLDSILKKDKEPTVAEHKNEPHTSVKLTKLFLMSGFFAVLPAVLLRTMIEAGTKNFAPTMLNMTYGIGTAPANLLGTVVVVGGLLGIVLAKFVLFPKIIKSEIAGCLILTVISIPFAAVVNFIGGAPIWSVVLSLTMINLLLTATHLFIQYYNMYFTKYGKNGTAAGIINAAASAGMAFQFWIFGPVAEDLGWPAVAVIWIVMMAVTALCLAIALRSANRFKKDHT